MRVRREAPSQLFLAGWLFADLLLALVVVLLGSMAAAPQGAEAQPTSSPSASATPSPSPSPSPDASEPPGIEQRPETLEIAVNTGALLAGSEAEEARLGRRIRDLTQPFNGRRAGIVLLWGYNPNLSIGVDMSEATKPIMRKWRRLMFADAATKQLGNTSGSNRVKLEIYYYK